MSDIEVVKRLLQFTEPWLAMHLKDFADDEMFVRPTAGANHIAWQLGHLIEAERHQISSQFPDAVLPTLPEGFAEAHTTATASRNGPDGFWKLSEYLELFGAMRKATIEVVGSLTDADLDRPTQGPLSHFIPTLRQLFFLIANHAPLHCGQITVVRRVLGKPHLF